MRPLTILAAFGALAVAWVTHNNTLLLLAVILALVAAFGMRKGEEA